jgi:hypothetical protein
MDDEIGLLTANERLFRLLDHYREKAGADRAVWADRVMIWDDATHAQLTRWHGTLLAAAWVEMNLAPTATAAANRVPDCYRITPAGRQALNRARSAYVSTAGTSSG